MFRALVAIIGVVIAVHGHPIIGLAFILLAVFG